MSNFNSLKEADDFCQDRLTSNWSNTSSLRKVPRFSHVYEFTRSTSGPLNIGVIGCQGHNAKEKLTIAKNIAVDRPHFMIGLGDTFYHHGVFDALDPLFDSHFLQYYSTIESGLHDTPFLSVLGNHDMNLQNRIKTFSGVVSDFFSGNKATPYDRMMAQVIRSYLQPKDKKNWYMMNQYYVVTTEYANIFFLNSNFLAFDVKQQTWLKETYNALNPVGSLNSKWNIVAMHHPLHSPGKRHLAANYDDIEQYSLPEFKDALKALKTSGICCLNYSLYNYFIRLNKEGICFQLFLGAHDHLLAAMWQRPSLPGSWQVISGAAGDPKELQRVEIPPKFRHDSPDNHGADFYYELNGHVKLDIINHRSIQLKIKDITNKTICDKLFQRQNALKTICIDT